MGESAEVLLSSIPELTKAKDAAALVGLKDHPDKRVRKAVGKALHVLKSRGVAIPDSSSKAWSPGDALERMRGDLQPLAMVDARAVPGALRFLLSEPNPVSGASLWAGTITPADRVIEFNAFSQTDGQRGRMLREWDRYAAERKPPVEWLKARIRWAREATVAGGFSVPRALDQALAQLGDSPADRPVSFLDGKLDDAPGYDPATLDAVLNKSLVPQWPPMVDLDPTLQRAAEIHGDKPQPTEDADRVELLRKSAAGDEGLRTALKGVLSCALEDAAIGMWIEGDATTARALREIAAKIQASAEPETSDEGVRILGYQVASLLRAVGGPAAIQRMQAQAAAQAAAGGHGHEHHDHDHDHDHGHHHHHDHDHDHDHDHG
jgi:hypothetical protein